MKKVLGFMLLFGLLLGFAYAGTGGAELDSWYVLISDSLQGTWGKIIAAFFIGTAIIIFKQGGIIGGIFMVLLGMSIGSIPGIINSKYSIIAGTPEVTSVFSIFTSFLG